MSQAFDSRGSTNLPAESATSMSSRSGVGAAVASPVLIGRAVPGSLRATGSTPTGVADGGRMVGSGGAVLSATGTPVVFPGPAPGIGTVAGCVRGGGARRGAGDVALVELDELFVEPGAEFDSRVAPVEVSFRGKDVRGLVDESGRAV